MESKLRVTITITAALVLGVGLALGLGLSAALAGAAEPPAKAEGGKAVVQRTPGETIGNVAAGHSGSLPRSW